MSDVAWLAWLMLIVVVLIQLYFMRGQRRTIDRFLEGPEEHWTARYTVPGPNGPEWRYQYVTDITEDDRSHFQATLELHRSQVQEAEDDLDNRRHSLYYWVAKALRDRIFNIEELSGITSLSEGEIESIAKSEGIKLG